MSDYNKNTPWINSDGSMKSLNELKLLSSNWSFEIWEEYLRTVEVIGKEQPQCNQYIDRTALESFIHYVSSTPKSKQRPLVKKAVKNAISSLTVNEFKIYQLLFKYELTPLEVAKKLSVNRGSITCYRGRIFEKVKKALIESNISMPYEALKSHYNRNLDAQL